MSDSKIMTIKSPILIEKAWGREEIYCNTDEYCGKKLVFNKGAKFSSHFHVKKHETFVCVKGKLRVYGVHPETAEPYELDMTPGIIIEVPRFCLHQIEALQDSEIIEFSTHHDDHDSYRVEKGDNQSR